MTNETSSTPSTDVWADIARLCSPERIQEAAEIVRELDVLREHFAPVAARALAIMEEITRVERRVERVLGPDMKRLCVHESDEILAVDSVGPLVNSVSGYHLLDAALRPFWEGLDMLDGTPPSAL